MRESYVLDWTFGSLLMLLVAAMAVTTALDHRMQMVPVVDPPYLGEWCIAPTTDAHLEACFGLSHPTTCSPLRWESTYVGKETYAKGAE